MEAKAYWPKRFSSPASTLIALIKSNITISQAAAYIWGVATFPTRQPPLTTP